jgi:hypothetical protein
MNFPSFGNSIAYFLGNHCDHLRKLLQSFQNFIVMILKMIAMISGRQSDETLTTMHITEIFVKITFLKSRDE